MAGAIVSTGKVDYTTPDDEDLPIISTVRKFFRAIKRLKTGVEDPNDPGIDLDPCSNPHAMVGAALNIQLEPVDPTDAIQTFIAKGAVWNTSHVQGDGLGASWNNCRTYVNPPFGRKKGGTSITDWVMKEQDSINTEVIYLIPDTPETDLWKNHILLQADGRCQLKQRVVFGNMFKRKKGSEELELDEDGHPIPLETGIPKPISLVYFGEHPDLFKKFFRSLGRVENPLEVYADQLDIIL